MEFAMTSRHWLFFLLPLTLSLGCGSEDKDGLDPDGDEDGDGLSNGDEIKLGTDPENPDSDDDGFDDGDEVASGTNPAYEFSHEYIGGYDVGYCNKPPSTTGPTLELTFTDSGQNYSYNAYQNGDVPDNFQWMDQHGEMVSLYSFCDRHVVIAVSAGWCGPCRSAAQTMQAEFDEFWGQDVQFIEIMMNNNTQGEIPDQAFLQGWASDYNFETIPVLSPGGTAPATIEEYLAAEVNAWDQDGYIPSFFQLDTSTTVVSADEGNTDPSAWLD
jgi:thiol-disulfide isomerase/thioredoxin